MQVSPISRRLWPEKRPLDQLEDEIVSLSHRINASEYEFLVLVREFDIRQGWRAYHFNNCSEWLNMKCGISLGAAREKVRVAKALFDLPLSSEAFSDGSLSYSKARALTRVANVRNAQELLDYAIHATASQVDDHCRVLRNAQRRESTTDANRLHRARYLSCSRHADGSVSISGELPKELGDLVMKALEVALASQERSSAERAAAECIDKAGDSFFAKQADALVLIATEYLAGGFDKTSSAADHYQVMVHVDESALRGQGGKSDLPIESVRRITCDSSIVTVTEDGQGTLLNVGRKHRVVSPQMKRALLIRDKGCRFPGCSHDHKWLDAHHVMHWADGGETSLANTLLICSSHHRLLHEGGYTIQKNFEGNWYFRNGDGRVIPSAPVYKPTVYDASRDAFVDKQLIDEQLVDKQLADEHFVDKKSIREPAVFYAVG